MKRILIDGRFVGVGDSQTRYVLPLVREILAIDRENEYTLLIRPVGQRELKRFPEITTAPNLQIKVLDIPHYTIAEQTKLLRYLNKEKFDLVHFTQFNHPILYRGNFVTTIQDLTLIGHLHYFNSIKQRAFNMTMSDAAKRSKRVIAISKNTRDEVADMFNVDLGKFDIIYHGLEHDRYTAGIKSKVESIKLFKEKYKIAGDYILYTGMWKKHKNLLRLLKAFEIFRIQNTDNTCLPARQGIQLVLAGRKDPKEPEVLLEVERINAALPNSIVVTGFVEEEELPIAYAGALAYCIPSLSEGFGWPPLEAMACGTPVIASKESCMPEILGDAAYYFDPYKVDDITKAIEKIVTDTDLRKELTRKGLVQVKKYNWSETAKKTIDVYMKALKQS